MDKKNFKGVLIVSTMSLVCSSTDMVIGKSTYLLDHKVKKLMNKLKCKCQNVKSV